MSVAKAYVQMLDTFMLEDLVSEAVLSAITLTVGGKVDAVLIASEESSGQKC